MKYQTNAFNFSNLLDLENSEFSIFNSFAYDASFDFSALTPPVTSFPATPDLSGAPAAVFELSSLLAANGGDGTEGFVINGINTDDSSGISVSSAGDINGDGFDDILIGAFSADPNGISGAGESYVIFGRASFGPQPSGINGTPGNDNLVGTSGIDQILGLGGNDMIEGLAGADVLDGGTEEDTLSYASSNAAVSVNLQTNTVSGGHAQGDTISNFEGIIGGGFGDTLTGSSGANQILSLIHI